MLAVKIICAGKLREKFYAAAAAEYTKRLSKKVKLEIIEVPDEKAPESLSEAGEARVKRAEGARMLEKISPADYVITLEINGASIDSAAFARKIDGLMASGKSRVAFVIGGSLGLSEEVMARSDFALSFSKFTFCHQLMRVILLEQIYRAFKILSNEPYHK